MRRAEDVLHRAVIDLSPDRLTLILFSQAGTVMAEIIGPPGYDDAVEPMPTALTTAHRRSPRPGSLMVLDHESLWQAGWSALEHT